jgi:hypothetical protein
MHWDCNQSLMKLTDHNRVQLIWLPGHGRIGGNETVHQLITKFYFQCTIGTKIPIPEISLNTRNYSSVRLSTVYISRALPPASHRGGAGSIPGQVIWDCVGQSGTGPGFLQILRFLLPILIPPNVPHSSITPSWCNRPTLAVPNGLSHSLPRIRGGGGGLSTHGIIYPQRWCRQTNFSALFMVMNRFNGIYWWHAASHSTSRLRMKQHSAGRQSGSDRS